ncbi:MAG: hypothetical protein ACXV5P_07870 [Halobacteriota archaeon]
MALISATCVIGIAVALRGLLPTNPPYLFSTAAPMYPFIVCDHSSDRATIHARYSTLGSGDYCSSYIHSPSEYHLKARKGTTFTVALPETAE